MRWFWRSISNFQHTRPGRHRSAATPHRTYPWATTGGTRHGSCAYRCDCVYVGSRLVSVSNLLVYGWCGHSYLLESLEMVLAGEANTPLRRPSLETGGWPGLVIFTD